MSAIPTTEHKLVAETQLQSTIEMEQDLKDFIESIQEYIPECIEKLRQYKKRSEIPSKEADELSKLWADRIKQGQEQAEILEQTLGHPTSPYTVNQLDYLRHSRIQKMIKTGRLSVEEAIKDTDPANFPKTYDPSTVSVFQSHGIRPHEIRKAVESGKPWSYTNLLQKYSFDEINSLTDPQRFLLADSRFWNHLTLDIVKLYTLTFNTNDDYHAFANFLAKNVSSISAKDFFTECKNFTKIKHYLQNPRIQNLIKEKKIDLRQVIKEFNDFPDSHEEISKDYLFMAGLLPSEIASIKEFKEKGRYIAQLLNSTNPSKHPAYELKDIRDLSVFQLRLLSLGFTLDIVKQCNQTQFQMTHELESYISREKISEDLIKALPKLNTVQTRALASGIKLEVVLDERFKEEHIRLLQKGFEWTDIANLTSLHFLILNSIHSPTNTWYVNRNTEITDEERLFAKQALRLLKPNLTLMHLMLLKVLSADNDIDITMAEIVLSFDERAMRELVWLPLPEAAVRLRGLNSRPFAHEPTQPLVRFSIQTNGQSTESTSAGVEKSKEESKLGM